MTRPAQTAIIVAAAIAVLVLVDRDLASIESRELAAEATSAWQQAEALSAEHQLDRAIPLYRRAVTLRRQSTTYRVSLARALTASHREREAEPILREVLATEPNDGAANLEMARLLRATGDAGAAAAYYHRSIYGSWPKASADRTQQVRLELAGLLADDHRSRDLLSELLLLDDYAKARPDLELQIARWYIGAGSAARAATVLRNVTATDTAPPEAWAALGDAELAAGNYRSAQTAYSTALRRGQRDVSERVVLTVELAQLDPTQRRLASAERIRRATAVLNRARHVLTTCPTANADLDAQAEAALTAVKQEDPEDLLDPAEAIWRYIGQTCPDSTHKDQALELLMARLVQQP